MIGLQNGSLKLFRVRGIDVFLHWTWFAVAYWELSHRKNEYSN